MRGLLLASGLLLRLLSGLLLLASRLLLLCLLLLLLLASGLLLLLLLLALLALTLFSFAAFTFFTLAALALLAFAFGGFGSLLSDDVVELVVEVGDLLLAALKFLIQSALVAAEVAHQGISLRLFGAEGCLDALLSGK